PQRTCVACRRSGDQRSFVRLVRSPEGGVTIDEGRRRAAGRGAYLCPDAACWTRALKGALASSLRTTISEADRAALIARAEGFTADTHAAAQTADGEREGDA
ncbi:MAG: YlxR family protein, partial [Chloroflexi bacterium]|nr:YlxR family protein [Chloroflexota bacterium]